MKLTAAICAVSALFAAACASAPATQVASGPQVDAIPGPALQGASMNTPILVSETSEDDGAKICRKLDPATGSRIGSRTVCMTQAEWDLREQTSRDWAKDVSTNGKWNLQSGN